MSGPVVDGRQEDGHDYVVVDDEEDDEEDGVEDGPVVGRHHHVRTVGRGRQHEHVPEGVGEVFEVGAVADRHQVLVLEVSGLGVY